MSRVKKTKAKKAPPAPQAKASAAEQLAEAKREVRRLRELRRLMRTIARKRLDAEADGLGLARLLVAGTEYVVVSELRIKQLEHDASDAASRTDAMSKDLDAAKKQLNPDTV